jgi:AraC-like DNA-binding protein
MDWEGVTVRIDWSRCTRRRWPPTAKLDFTPQERRKERNVLLYWWAGRGQRKLPSGLASIHAGLCHWARPGWTYECTQSTRNPLGVTAIHFDLLDARGRVIPPEDARLPPEQLRVRAPHLAEEVTRWIAERGMDARAGVRLCPQIRRAAGSLLLGLLIKLDHDTPAVRGPASGPDPAAWRRLTAHIQDHLHDLGGLSQLADRAGYTRSHFSRLFKAHVGLSPREYVINARIALAKELLRGTTLAVSEVAKRAGYGDAFQFSKQFRQHAAKTPSAYRAECGRLGPPAGRSHGRAPLARLDADRTI